MWNSAESVSVRSESFREDGDDEEALRWAALNRLPTYRRVQQGIFLDQVGDAREIDVRRMQADQRKIVLDRLIDSLDGDWEKFFSRLRRRFLSADLDFPKVEIRYDHLTVETFVHIGRRALPTIPNFLINMTEDLLRGLRLHSGNRKKLTILNDVSGKIQPGRLTLLLGPPGSGKTTLLLALAGRLKNDLKVSGKVTYNGHGMNDFVPQRTSAYVSQQDWHVGEMTVRETLDFSARCQGAGYKYDMLLELLRREKISRTIVDEDLDILIKALSLDVKEAGLLIEYIMKILGLDLCSDTLVGDEMIKGISGGQKKRLTTGEILVGPSRVLCMDEISTGLDSATTFHIIKYLRHYTRSFDGTTIISLLQPAPETYELFDDIILLSEGRIVYNGPREHVLEFFAHMGFFCPERKNVADFLQEVVSRKDQEQYWASPNHPYQFIPVVKFAESFRAYKTAKLLHDGPNIPSEKYYYHPDALSCSKYGVKNIDLLKINFDWQVLLMKRNLFIYVFKFIQLLLVAVITMTVFCRTTLHHDTINDGGLYLGLLYFSMVIILFNGFTEVSLLVTKLPILYKHRDLHFYPSWAYTLPAWLLSVPTSFIESGIWVLVTYYVVGYDPNFSRFLRQFMLFFFCIKCL